MLSWGRFIDTLRKDGVELGESELEAVTEGGDRIIAKTLSRWADGRVYWIAIDFQDPTDRVPVRTIRQVANVLRLPAEKYILGDREL